MKIKGTVSTNDFNAQGNNSRIAINNGDDHIQITDNTYAFDHAAIGYLGHLSLLQVITAAYHEKRAQDKTTVRKSEFHFPSDGPKTDQTDNVLAVATTPFARNTLERIASEACSDGQTFHQGTGYHKFDVADQTLERVYLASTPAGGVNHRFDHRYEFDSIGAITRRTGELKNFGKKIIYERLDRMTDATLVGTYTVAASCDDLGTITNRNSNSGLSDLSAYDDANGTNRSSNSEASGHFFLISLKKND